MNTLVGSATLLVAAFMVPAITIQHTAAVPSIYNVRDYGAKGDGESLDTGAINHAIDAAAANGGGTVVFPAGTYKSLSIHLKSNISLVLQPGSILLAAKAEPGTGYDPAEESPNTKYQDFGHSHFHNSLIWGEDLENVTIEGHGQIYGKGLVNGGNKPEEGNKSISLLRCRNVTIRDITIRHGGWFAILATGIDHLTIDNIIIDTNRDGMDIDCCRDVHVSNCSVNSPADDGICLKSSYALNEARACEDISITNCHVSGFDEGTFLDGTYGKKGRGATGRIKFGTESNGGFKNIAISNCVFDHCRGFALEAVDGAQLEDVTISNITMRDIINSPIFLRIGRRMRGPEGVPVGSLRRVSFDNIRVDGAREGCIIAGLKDNPIEGVSFTHVRILANGGAPASQSEIVPKELETDYPEPSSFGKLPAYGFFIRHAKNVEFNDVELNSIREDGRPPFQLEDVANSDFVMLRAQTFGNSPIFELKSVKLFRARMVDGIQDTQKDNFSGKL